jgi:hypothetical protein
MTSPGRFLIIVGLGLVFGAGVGTIARSVAILLGWSP